jgi:hypothetical protein
MSDAPEGFVNEKKDRKITIPRRRRHAGAFAAVQACGSVTPRWPMYLPPRSR